MYFSVVPSAIADAAVASQDPRVIKLDLLGVAKELGNPRASGSVALGAALKLLGVPMSSDDAPAIFARFLREDLVPVNVAAVQAGYDAVAQQRGPLHGDHAGDL